MIADDVLVEHPKIRNPAYCSVLLGDDEGACSPLSGASRAEYIDEYQSIQFFLECWTVHMGYSVRFGVKWLGVRRKLEAKALVWVMTQFSREEMLHGKPNSKESFALLDREVLETSCEFFEIRCLVNGVRDDLSYMRIIVGLTNSRRFEFQGLLNTVLGFPMVVRFHRYFEVKPVHRLREKIHGDASFREEVTTKDDVVFDIWSVKDERLR